MTKVYQTLLLLWGVLASHLVAAQTLPEKPFDRCGTPALTKEYLAANPEIKARVEAIEKQTQQYIKDAAATSGKEAPGSQARPLIVIPVVVHVVWKTTSQNLSDAVVQEQIDILNADFRKLNADVAQVPGVFAPFASDVRVSFCLATRDPNGDITNGITRHNTTENQFFRSSDRVKSASTGGADAWNTTQYLNIWCCNLGTGPFDDLGYGTFPGTAASGRDGVVVSTGAFGKGAHLNNQQRFGFGRTATHEVGHYLNLRHIWGDATCGNDFVNDTPEQQSSNLNKPTFPKISTACGNGPNGDMFMNYMDYSDDDVMVMFSAGQAQRMQAIIAPNGVRAALRNSPGLSPTLSIASTGGIPSAVICGDRTEYRFRAEPISPGCGGGTVRYEWAATNGWTVTGTNWYSPVVTPSGNSGSTITLTGTYVNANGASIPLNTASITVGYNPVPPAPVFISGDNMICQGQSGIYTVAAVPGAAGYLWTINGDFTPNGLVTTTAPSLTITPNPGLAAGTYSILCQIMGNGCSNSAQASRSFNFGGGSPFIIVDVDPAQRYQGYVCQRNRLRLMLVPVVPGAGITATGIVWSSGQTNIPTNPNAPLENVYLTTAAGGIPFTVDAQYTDACGNTRFAISYNAITTSLGPPYPALGIGGVATNYSCIPNQWRMAPTIPFPNPATGSLQLPGYRGQVVVYNQQGKPVHRLQAPGTDYGTTLDTSAWPDGLYVVVGCSLAGEFVRHSIQVQH